MAFEILAESCGKEMIIGEVMIGEIMFLQKALLPWFAIMGAFKSAGGIVACKSGAQVAGCGCLDDAE